MSLSGKPLLLVKHQMIAPKAEQSQSGWVTLSKSQCKRAHSSSTGFSCGEFNALGMTRFFSLAKQSFSLKCDKFMAAYNVFGQLQDSAFDVEFGLADIQGNTFETLTGKPFLDLRPKPIEVREENETVFLLLCRGRNMFGTILVCVTKNMSFICCSQARRFRPASSQDLCSGRTSSPQTQLSPSAASQCPLLKR